MLELYFKLKLINLLNKTVKNKCLIEVNSPIVCPHF